uniref:Uncharacterized protein n=1 Tax=Oryza sativa subsp. japonica TaxID=39947 RepID=Q75K71_ORYSJ|nr:unknown protein [Oryza sativa Japonica Group]AAT93879.1 unknown protein [Oryza sativa Japonica Group]
MGGRVPSRIHGGQRGHLESSLYPYSCLCGHRRANMSCQHLWHSGDSSYSIGFACFMMILLGTMCTHGLHAKLARELYEVDDEDDDDDQIAYVVLRSVYYAWIYIIWSLSWWRTFYKYKSL